MTSTESTSTGGLADVPRLASGSAPEARRWWALAVLALVQFTIVIDTTVVNVALPTIGRELDVGVGGLSWVVNGYLLAAGGLLLLGGRLADVCGRRRLFLVGTTVFAVASLCCALAPSSEALIAARFAQGAGEAMASPAALSIIALLFPDRGERGKALGIWGGLAGVGATVGVVLSGAMTDTVGWRWLFVLNLPFALAALVLVPRLVRRDSAPAVAGSRRLDLPGAVLVTGGATALVSGVLSAAREGWTDATTLLLLGLAAAALASFVVVESRTEDPLVPLRFFRDRTRVSANAATVFVVGVMAGMFLLLTLYTQGVLGYSPLRTGMVYVPFCVVFVAGIGLAIPIMQRFGERATLLTAFAVALPGMLLLSQLPVQAGYLRDLLPALLVLAVGLGMAFPALQTAALNGVSDEDAGLAAGVQIAVQALSTALGVAVLLSFAIRTTAEQAALGVVADEAATAGYRVAFTAGAGSLALGFLLVLVTMPRRSRSYRRDQSATAAQAVSTSATLL